MHTLIPYVLDTILNLHHPSIVMVVIYTKSNLVILRVCISQLISFNCFTVELSLNLPCNYLTVELILKLSCILFILRRKKITKQQNLNIAYIYVCMYIKYDPLLYIKANNYQGPSQAYFEGCYITLHFL